jgi:hypothetical protein
VLALILVLIFKKESIAQELKSGSMNEQSGRTECIIELSPSDVVPNGERKRKSGFDYDDVQFKFEVSTL